MTDRSVLRLGSWAAIVGGVLAIIFNALHPRFGGEADPVAEELRIVAENDMWVPIHLGIFVSLLLITFGLFAFARSMKGGPAEGLSRVALGALVLSAPVALLTTLVDGYATKAVADAAADSPAAAAAGAAVAHTGWALFRGLTILYLGITPIAFGLASANDGGYPSWMGWAAVVFGSVSVLTGVYGVLTGSSPTFFLIFSIASGVLTLWVIALGVLLGRRAAGPVTVPEGTVARPKASTTRS